jgi:NhaC family Na+:H+ antiporter
MSGGIYKMENSRATVKGSALVLLIIIAVLAVSIVYYGAMPHIPLLLGAMVATLYGMKIGYKCDDIEKYMVRGISQGLPAILILCLEDW